MKRHAVAVALAISLVGCSDDTSGPPDGSGTDAVPNTDVEGLPICNLLSQTGCLATEKCTFSWNPPLPGPPLCAPDGSVGDGEACAIDGDSGIDNCEKGLACHDGSSSGTVCSRLCGTIAGDCAVGTCMTVDEIAHETNGVCVP